MWLTKQLMPGKSIAVFTTEFVYGHHLKRHLKSVGKKADFAAAKAGPSNQDVRLAVPGPKGDGRAPFPFSRSWQPATEEGRAAFLARMAAYDSVPVLAYPYKPEGLVVQDDDTAAGEEANPTVAADADADAVSVAVPVPIPVVDDGAAVSVPDDCAGADADADTAQVPPTLPPPGRGLKRKRGSTEADEEDHEAAQPKKIQKRSHHAPQRTRQQVLGSRIRMVVGPGSGADPVPDLDPAPAPIPEIQTRPRRSLRRAVA
jgi:hypothetical protein